MPSNICALLELKVTVDKGRLSVNTDTDTMNDGWFDDELQKLRACVFIYLPLAALLCRAVANAL